MAAMHRFPLKDPRPLGGSAAFNKPPQAPPLIPRESRHLSTQLPDAPSSSQNPPSLPPCSQPLPSLPASSHPPATSLSVSHSQTSLPPSSQAPPFQPIPPYLPPSQLQPLSLPASAASGAPPACPAHVAPAAGMREGREEEGRRECRGEEGSFAARVASLERLLRRQEAEISGKEKTIERLQQAQAQLQRENRELHRFLADYGMHWVGPSNRTETSTSPPSTSPPSASPPSPSPPSSRQPPPDVEAVRIAVRELNALAGGGGAEVVMRRDGSHGLELSPRTLTLTLWPRGMQIDEAELRPYETRETVAFLRDLLDGYFPYELKALYPEGVIFSLVDKTREEGGDHEWGAGRVLNSRGEGGRSLLRDEGEWLVDEGRPSRPPSGKRGGKVGALSGEISRLRIKGPSGAVALVTELPVETTVGELRSLLEARGLVRGGQSYELRTSFPTRTLSDPRKSLTAAGLTPSASLLLTLPGAPRFP